MNMTKELIRCMAYGYDISCYRDLISCYNVTLDNKTICNFFIVQCIFIVFYVLLRIISYPPKKEDVYETLSDDETSSTVSSEVEEDNEKASDIDQYYYNCRFDTVEEEGFNIPYFIGPKSLVDNIAEYLACTMESKELEYGDVPAPGSSFRNPLGRIADKLVSSLPDSSISGLVAGTVLKRAAEHVDDELNSNMDKIDSRMMKAQSVLRNGRSLTLSKMKT